jgi:HIUase/Transthyretin family
MNVGWTSRRSLLRTARPLVTLAAASGVMAQSNPSAGLTTHMLDTSNGKPASGVRIDFSALEGDNSRFIKTVHTNADGRNDQPLLTADSMAVWTLSARVLRRGVFLQAWNSAPKPALS